MPIVIRRAGRNSSREALLEDMLHSFETAGRATTAPSDTRNLIALTMARQRLAEGTFGQFRPSREATVEPVRLVRDEHGQEGDSELSVEEYIQERRLGDALISTAEILREVFGPEAELRPRLDRDRETGEWELVAEAHFNIDVRPDRLEEVQEQDERFLARYVEEIPTEDRRRIALVRLPGNGD